MNASKPSQRNNAVYGSRTLHFYDSFGAPFFWEASRPRSAHCPLRHRQTSLDIRFISCSAQRPRLQRFFVCRSAFVGFPSAFEAPARSLLKSLQPKKRICRDCRSQAFCEVCAMCPPPAMSSPQKQKLRVLCLHGFRTSGKIMETQLAKLDSSVLDLLDMVFLDGSYPAKGKSDVEGFFDPPYYEWFQFERTETTVNYQNLNECIEFISDIMERQGPFDGLVGFSQGSFLAAALAGMQQQGLGLTSIPALRFVIIISGGVLDGEHQWKGCYTKPIRCPSVHLIGEKDFLKPSNEKLLLKFKNPVVVRHAARHTVPRLDATAVLPIKKFLEDIRASRDQKYDLSDWTAEACAA